MNFSIHHVSITCSHISESEHFYGLFGFSKLREYKDEQTKICLLGNEYTGRIELFEFSEECSSLKRSCPLPDIMKIGITHFALQVDNLEEVRNRLLSNNLKCSKIIQARLGGFKYFFTADPDSNQVELLELE